MQRWSEATGGGRKRPFTLVEMLVVLMLTAVFMGIVVGVGPGLAKATAVTGGARNVGKYLHVARQQAMVNRDYIAVLFPANFDNAHNHYNSQSWRPCVVDDTNNFQRWLGDAGSAGLPSKWEFLPDGVVFDAFTADAVNGVVAPEGNVDNVRAVVFQPNGQLRNDATVTLRVGRGNHPVGGTVELDIDTDPNAQEPITITVNWLTGRATYE